ncbi:MAG TPA: pitrilysin family protein [Phycisphaerae bacterium]|jgi:zinc protease
MHLTKRAAAAALLLMALAPLAPAWAQTAPAASAPALQTGSSGSQTWSTEILGNGLKVIYAPMPASPTTHTRVIYHVGSRDERSDRQGFAHMFEHMMFRGSAHVAPEEHMKLIGLVGGYSNAFTSFDETVYVNTLPASYTQMALWLEADRMSSFKVSRQIFETERKVVGEEFRMRLNQPYGGMFDQLMPEVFKNHPYQWTPIGNMQHLQAADLGDIQAFFSKYYVPNNAILVIAGNIDVAKTRQQVNDYFGWIPPRGLKDTVERTTTVTNFVVDRHIPQEPPQTEPRRLEIKMTAPLPRVLLAYRMPRNDSPDIDTIGLLLTVLGDGESSRIYRSLVTTENPLCVSAGAVAEPLEDGGLMGIMATVLNGKDPAAVEKILRTEIAAVRDKPVTAEELEKAKQQERMRLAERFETAEKVATELGDEMLAHNDLSRVPTARARLEATTVADLQRVAKTYFQDAGTNTMIITPGTPAPPAAALAAATAPNPSTAPATPPVIFPKDFPVQPPMSGKLPEAVFEKGTETTVNLTGSTGPGHVIVMEEHRMPTINWTLALRSGSHAEPKGKEGLASMTAAMLERGPKGKTYDEFNDALESRAITLGVSDGGDVTKISGNCLKEQFPYAVSAMTQMLLTPAFDEGEFGRLKDQMLSELTLSLNNAQTLASRELTKDLYGDSPLGRLTTPASISAITLDDVKKFYADNYRADGAVMMISGDIATPDGQKIATNILTGMKTGGLPVVQYPTAQTPPARRIVLIDKPDAKQSAIRLAIPAYSIKSDEKFAGSLANQMLSAGIESRLGRYVRAEKGYVYGVQAIFSPNRQAGAFVGQTDTKFETTADTVTAMFKVFDDMKAAEVPAPELADAKFRVAGSLLMSMETISDQAARRVDGMLNGYPADYYDKYSQRISQVDTAQIKTIMNKYAQEDHMIVVVVAPAAAVKDQLEKLGKVEVVPAGP